MSRFIIGVDPGKTGALALWDPETRRLLIEDVPTAKTGKKGRLTVDHYSLARVIDTWAVNHPTVYLEAVGTRPGEGAVGAFDFGRTFGVLLGICAAHFLRVELVTPATWKTAMRVKGDKDESRMRASTLLPDQSGLWPLKKHDGRAEAALIALYGSAQG